MPGQEAMVSPNVLNVEAEKQPHCGDYQCWQAGRHLPFVPCGRVFLGKWTKALAKVLWQRTSGNNIFLFFLIFPFVTVSHYVLPDGLELIGILLPLPPGWNYRPSPPHSAL